MPRAAMRIIAEEHRALRSVVGSLQRLARDLVDGRAVDLGRAEDILRYIDEFPRKVHHPKEDALLFDRLRLRTDELGRVISELERDHLEEEAMLRELRERLKLVAGAFERGRDFACLVDEYAGFLLRHMTLEESLVLRLAEARLEDEDWAEIDAGFLANADPISRSQSSEELKALYRRIVMADAAAGH